jgi:hypothetical protein
MDDSRVERLGNELQRLMREQIDSLAKRTFLGITPDELRLEKQRLQRIREASADYLEALKTTSS